MYPGYESFPTGELERKKMLLRAERRNEVVKQAKDASLPISRMAKQLLTPTHPRLTRSNIPLTSSTIEDRDHEDKQMVGQKPFPDVGPVDGLHPSPDSADVRDEFKRKQLLQRAGLSAKFQKSGDIAEHAWYVFGEDKKLLLSKTVDELTNGAFRTICRYCNRSFR